MKNPITIGGKQFMGGNTLESSESMKEFPKSSKNTLAKTASVESFGVESKIKKYQANV